MFRMGSKHEPGVFFFSFPQVIARTLGKAHSQTLVMGRAWVQALGVLQRAWARLATSYRTRGSRPFRTAILGQVRTCVRTGENRRRFGGTKCDFRLQTCHFRAENTKDL